MIEDDINRKERIDAYARAFLIFPLLFGTIASVGFGKIGFSVMFFVTVAVLCTFYIKNK